MPHSLKKRKEPERDRKKEREQRLANASGQTRELFVLHYEAMDLKNEYRWREAYGSMRRACSIAKECGFAVPTCNALASYLYDGGYLTEAAQELRGVLSFTDQGYFDRGCCQTQTRGMVADVAMAFPLSAVACTKAIQEVERAIEERGESSWHDITQYLWGRFALLQGRWADAARHARAGLKLEHDECPSLYTTVVDSYSTLSLVLVQALVGQYREATRASQRTQLMQQLGVVLEKWDKAHCLRETGFGRAAWRAYRATWLLMQAEVDGEAVGREAKEALAALDERPLTTPSHAELVERIVMVALASGDKALAECAAQRLKGAELSESKLVRLSGLRVRAALGEEAAQVPLAALEHERQVVFLEKQAQ